MTSYQEKLDKAFAKVDRKDFVPESKKHQASLDVPLSIGEGQTISQPTTVRHMLEWLRAEPGNKVLEVGSGSGWAASLLKELVGEEGEVYAVERKENLLEFGRRNAKVAGYDDIKFSLAKKNVFGLPGLAPFDRILVSAAYKKIPDDLTSQLNSSGKMVIPVRNSIFEVEKNDSGQISTKEHFGYTFVPLVK